ncbi:Quinone-oxidoreductase QR2 [Porphyridium purpureum]|uniref:Quinone-oxidoreductase QR2 n=1 Tax=Porphyridium purpureum TaxID=35688 RepID=A0A5J4YND1_PORPP|nr:Quinone-oxidoreductase QR2 [Porphyridium purpureum]|eukprot:POR3886..scf222_8
MATKRILVLYYSMYGHIKKQADMVKAGIETAGCEAIVMQVPETLPQDVLTKMGAPPKAEEYKTFTREDMDLLVAVDGIMFGIPTRFGTMPAQMKAFFDGLGGLWAQGKLNGKMASVFFSTGTIGGGQETTALTTVPVLTHLGMIFVPMGYTHPEMMVNTLRGSSAYGSGMLANGDGSRQASDLELAIAKHHGEYFAGIDTPRPHVGSNRQAPSAFQTDCSAAVRVAKCQPNMKMKLEIPCQGVQNPPFCRTCPPAPRSSLLPRLRNPMLITA